MNVVQISFFLDPEGRDPEALVESWDALRHGVQALASEGLRPHVVVPARRGATIVNDGISYEFAPIPAGSGTRWLRGMDRLLAAVECARPDVLHVHGIMAPFHVGRLRRRFPNIPIVVQDHANAPPSKLGRWLGRRVFRRVEAVAFTAADQAEPFFSSGVIPRTTPVFEILEASTTFETGDRDRARAECGVAGDPAVLWVGRLDENKDPMTVLEAVDEAAGVLPGIELWCLFHEAPLLEAVRKRIETSPRLGARIHLVGGVPHRKVEPFCRAADMFVTASRREGSGFALIEAVACGMTPVATSIPSFQRITGNGRIGALFVPGSGEELAAAIVRFGRAEDRPSKEAVRCHFEESLSWGAIAREWRKIYETLVEAA